MSRTAALRIDDRIARNRKEADRLDDLHPSPAKARIAPVAFDSPESSTITGAAYHRATETMLVMFKHGKQYRYAGVPFDIWADFSEAESKGSYFATYIRPRYEGTLVKK